MKYLLLLLILTGCTYDAAKYKIDMAEQQATTCKVACGNYTPVAFTTGGHGSCICKL